MLAVLGSAVVVAVADLAQVVLADLARRALGDEPPGVHEREAPALRGLLHVVRGDEQRHALAGEVVEQVPEVAARHRVDAARGFVEEEQLGLVDGGGAEREALLPADRQVRGQLVLAAHEVRHLEHVGALPGELLGGQVVDAGVEAQVLVDGQVLEQRELLAHVADAALGPLGVGDDVLAEDADAARLRGDRAGEHADRRGLAAAVGAEEAEDLAASHVEVDAVDGGEVAEALGQAAHGDGDVGGVTVAPLRERGCSGMGSVTSATS